MPSFTQVTRRRTGGVLMLLGGVLLTVAVAGQWTSWGHHEGYEKRDWESFEPGLVAKVRDYPALVRTVDARMGGNATDAEKMRIMYDVIVNRFTHDEAMHTLSSNWILYGAGFVHPVFRHIWSPDSLVSHGYSLLCDQSSYLLLHLATAHGFKSRHVGLQGHVVMEVWHDHDWHLYDPDLEVIPLNASGEVLSLDELAMDETLLEKYYGPFPHMPELVRSRENHLYMSTPDEARFEWKANLLAMIEKVTEVLKFLIPALLLLAGYRLARRPARGKSSRVPEARVESMA